jgi:hypothetical protein
MSGLFGISLSANKNNSKTTTNSVGTFNGTTTPIVPDWAVGPVQGAADRIGKLLEQDPNNFVAPAHALQQQAGVGAAGLNNAPNDFAHARDLTQAAANTAWTQPFMQADTPFASGGKAYNWMGQYENKYVNDVVNSTTADLDANAGQVRAQQALDLAGSGAFGGSGAALTQSMTEGELARARASTLSGLRSDAFKTALGAAAGDADRATQARIANAQMALQDRAQKVGFGFQGQQQQLQAAGQLANLAGNDAANQRANIATQLSVGDALRNVNQQQLLAPMVSTEQIVAMLNNLPIGLFTGQSQQNVTTENSTSKTKGSSIGATVSASNG